MWTKRAIKPKKDNESIDFINQIKGYENLKKEVQNSEVKELFNEMFSSPPNDALKKAFEDYKEFEKEI